MFDPESGDFSGGVFSKEIEGGRASAEIILREDAIYAHTQRGQQFRLPYSQCALEMGGSSGRMVFCRNEDRSLTIFCEEKDFPSALANNRWAGLETQVESMLAKNRLERRRGRYFSAVALAIVLLVLVGGYFGVKAAARSAVQAVPMSVDERIGNLAIKSMELAGPELKDEVVLKEINKIVDGLAEQVEAEDVEFTLHVVEAAVVNAFALPGGHIVVHTGLIEKCTEAEQLAGVIAHEMAHVTLRHGLERISQSLGIAAAFTIVLGDVEGIAVVGVELLEMATVNSYSRDQEAEADAEGVRLMQAAGWDPMALASFFELLKAEHEEGHAALAWISTHPQHDERINAVAQHVKQLPPLDPQPIDVDWQEVRRRIGSD